MMPLLFTSTVIVFICVWVLNPLTIAAILRSHAIRTTYSNIFILNLAVADLLLITMALALTSQQLGNTGEYLPRLCVLKIIGFGTLVMGSILSSFAIAVDRFLYIAKPVRYPTIVTHSRVLGSVVITWLLALANTLLPFYKETGFHETTCNNSTKKDPLLVLSMAIMATVFVVLQVISTCMYIKMFLIIQKHRKFMESQKLSMVRSVSSGTDNTLLKPATFPGDSDSKNRSNIPQNASSPAVDLEFCDPSRTSLKASESDQPYIQPSDITLAVQVSLDDKENVVPKTSQDDLQDNRDNGANSRVAPFRIEGENGGRPNLEPKVKSVYHIPFLTRNKRLISASSQQSLSSEEESQSTARISERRKFKKCKCRYSLRDLRTLKTLMLMGNLYFLCWSPLMIMKTLGQCFSIEIDPNIVQGVAVFGIFNSVLNFIVYPLRKAELRNTFKKMLLPVKKKFLAIMRRDESFRPHE